jgi:hypothetical protein
MPERLWDAAASLAREHGIYAISQGLGVNYDSLRARVEAGQGKRNGGKVARAGFVEIGPSLSPTLPTGPVVELTGVDGEKLTLRLGGATELELVRLVREFWSRKA